MASGRGRAVDLGVHVLTDLLQSWTPEAADERSRAAGLGRLTELHWRLISLCREKAAIDGELPSIEELSVAAQIPPDQIAALFRNRPRHLLAAIAGLPAPLPAERSIR
jgi:sulfur relay (sulfurtransferase) DsrC/TusE family protein